MSGVYQDSRPLPLGTQDDLGGTRVRKMKKSDGEKYRIRFTKYY